MLRAVSLSVQRVGGLGVELWVPYLPFAGVAGWCVAQFHGLWCRLVLTRQERSDCSFWLGYVRQPYGLPR